MCSRIAVGQAAILDDWFRDFAVKSDAIVEDDLDEYDVLADSRKDLGVDLGCGDGVIASPLPPIAWTIVSMALADLARESTDNLIVC